MNNIEQYLDTVGPRGSEERLQAIAGLGLGERSEAAKRALEKRSFIREWMDKGMTWEDAKTLYEIKKNRENEVN